MTDAQVIRDLTLATDRLAGLFGMVHDHWYRTGEALWYRSDDGGPCAYRDCGRSADRHFRLCGEWTMPRGRDWRAGRRGHAREGERLGWCWRVVGPGDVWHVERCVVGLVGLRGFGHPHSLNTVRRRVITQSVQGCADHRATRQPDTPEAP